MTPYNRTIATVEAALRDTFNATDVWFDRPAALRNFKPRTGWTIAQVLEHITLTNHFLLLTLQKHTDVAQRRARKQMIQSGESDLQRLLIIGERGSFGWPRPVHMEPQGTHPEEVRATLRSQLLECLEVLNRLRNGEGSLCRITMTVNKLGKIDLYQWLYFIAQHTRRHLQQMAATEADYAVATV